MMMASYTPSAAWMASWADYIIPCGDGPQEAERLISTIYLEVSQS